MKALRIALVLTLVVFLMLSASPRGGGSPEPSVADTPHGVRSVAALVPPSSPRPTTRPLDLPGRLLALLARGREAAAASPGNGVAGLTVSASSSDARPAGQPPTCVASWFGEELRGAPMASGRPFDPDELVAARWDVPFGTRYRVTAADTGRSVVVEIADRGPARRLGRCIDLSAAAFDVVADRSVGLIDVYLEELP